MTGSALYSIVVPVYGNEGSIPLLLERLEGVSQRLDGALEVVFVIDASPDDSSAVLRRMLPTAGFRSQILEHSRNFGSFPAIRTGMKASTGEFIAVMAADLQEPPELVLDFFAALSSRTVDVTVGRRESRNDPTASKISSGAFWKLYRRLVFPDMPEGGVDIFACNRTVANEILALDESNSSLVGLLYWVGFRRMEIPYSRQERQHGKSGWSLRKKVQYLLDSIFSFTDLPLTVLIGVGLIGTVLTVAVSIFVLTANLLGGITQPGYTALMLVILFSTFVLLVALGIVGTYVWRAFENTKRRPGAIVMSHWISDVVSEI